ncbi:MAG: matrixin family metalloprotease [Elusimicrobiota bacterium]|nr:MAG: matrixin family metalloprotease [Elusimicrobiota bacterium]
MGEASGVLSLRRREASGDPVNIWIAWVDYGGRGPVGQARDNQRTIDGPEPGEAVKNFGGFRNVAYPDQKKSSAALFFNQRYCWHLGNKDECEPPPTTPSGKVPEYQFDARIVALHEGGHVMGFGHFTNDSIMGHSGGTGRYELTAYDREAARRLYERVAASVPLQ